MTATDQRKTAVIDLSGGTCATKCALNEKRPVNADHDLGVGYHKLCGKSGGIVVILGGNAWRFGGNHVGLRAPASCSPIEPWPARKVMQCCVERR